ncbi:MAG: ParA family protein [Halothece sp.]
MGYIVSVVNMKGGVGKTTVTLNLATCLAKIHGKRVLIVDLDTQINATLSVMPPLQFSKLKQEKRTLKTLISQTIQIHPSSFLPIQEIIQANICQVKGMDLLPGDIELYNDFLLADLIYSNSEGDRKTFEKAWNQFEDRLLREILQPVINDYDFIFLDFSPGDHFLTRSGLVASDYYLIPSKPEPLSVVGIGLLEGRIKQLRESDRAKLTLIGIIFTALGHATNLAPKIKSRLSQDFGEYKIFKTEIPTNIAVAKAVDQFQPVVINDPQASGAKAFMDFSQEFLEKLVSSAIQ